MNISHKLHVSALQNECLTFLLTHAAGRPIKAMRIAELFEEEELYRESSRFVLDNPGGWSEEELGTLSQATLLKLEKRYDRVPFTGQTEIKSISDRRTWFLERVLKLGLVQIAKEYQCVRLVPHCQRRHSPRRFGAVPIMSGLGDLCASSRREVEAGLPGRLPIRCVSVSIALR